MSITSSTPTANGASITPPGPLTAEAERLRGAFEALATRELSVMTASARAIVRAWAKAELAIEAARASQEPGAADIPSAEAFRVRPYIPREEASRERITRWCALNGPISDELNAQVVHHNGSWVIMHPGTTRPASVLGDRADYERITHIEPQERKVLPLLAESLSIPALIAGNSIGWEPDLGSNPARVLARLDELEAGISPYPAERARTVEHVLLYHVSRPKPGAPA